LARTLQQVLDSANALFERTGLMLVDHAGALRWASASDQVAAPVSAGRSGSPRAWPRSGSMYSSFSTRRLRVVHRREDTQVVAHDQLVGQDRSNVHRSFHSPDRKR
jgi:hypothetical protein